MAEDVNEAAEDGEKGSAKSRVIRIIIVGVVILVCVGAGILGWLKFKKGSDEPSEPDTSVSENSASTEKGSDLGNILPLEPFIVNLSEPEGKRYLKTKIELELGAGSVNGEVKSRMPQLRDMILLYLSSKSMDEIQGTTGKIALRNELIMRINQILKQSKVRNLYFTEFVVQ